MPAASPPIAIRNSHILLKLWEQGYKYHDHGKLKDST